MSTDKLFLETTIQIERIFGRKKEEIVKFLSDKEALSSNYVLMEFKRTMLKDCISLYSFLNELQTNDEFEGVCNVIKEILKDYKKARGRKNCWKLGDCIISLEAPKGYKIFTTDHHYKQICNSLEKEILLLQDLKHATTHHF